MTSSTLGSMTVEHFDGETGKSLLFAQVSITDLAQILFTVLENKLESDFSQTDAIRNASPLQTCLVS